MFRNRDMKRRSNSGNMMEDIKALKYYRVKVLISALVILLPVSALAYDINEKLSIGGVLAGAYQYQSVSDTPGFENTGRGAVPFQPELSFRPTDKDEVFLKFGFAAGNALNDGTSPFVLAPWAADLEDDVKDINGRNRDYLLTAWYKHTFRISEGNSVDITGGIIDSTDYLDENAYANNEYTQFMNEALVNDPDAFLPSYDIGGAIQWHAGGFILTGVAMAVGENDDGNSYNYYAGQLAYTVDWRPGEGNYRVIAATTTDKFSNPQGTDLESLRAFILSFDQEAGEYFGLWIRFGWQADDAAVNHKAIYSGGVNIAGSLWKRADDNIGLGYAYLNGGNQGIDKSQVIEWYYRFVLNEYFAVTADVQYMKDDYRDDPDFNPKGFILGLRAAVEF
jgi:porin